MGYLADRLGQKRVLLVSAVVNAVLVCAVVAMAYSIGEFTVPATVAMLGTALLAGATSPQVGPLSRVRWMALSKKLPKKQQGPVVDTALSLEGTADEVTFVLGPALVGLLASLVAPWLPLVLAAAMTVTLVTCSPSTPPRPPSARAKNSVTGNAGYVPAEPIKWLRVAVPVLGMVCMGTFFGSSQTALDGLHRRPRLRGPGRAHVRRHGRQLRRGRAVRGVLARRIQPRLALGADGRAHGRRVTGASCCRTPWAP